MAVFYHRVHSLNLLQSLHMKSSISILRGMPDIAALSTKAGNPKKPIRYTSIRKAKPKTITDIGNLLLQRASRTKESRQSGIGEVALKATTETVSNSKPTTGHVPANSKTVAAKRPVTKAVPEVSIISTPSFTTTVNRCVDNSFEISTHVNEGETVSQPSVTRDNLSTNASASSELSSPFFTPFSVSVEEITSTHHAIPEPVPVPALAPETYSGVHPIAGKDLDMSPDQSLVISGSRDAISSSKDTEIIHAFEDVSSTRAVSVSEVNDIIPMQEGASVENSAGPNTCTHRIHAPLTTLEVKNSQTQGIAPELSREIIQVTRSKAVQDLGSLESPGTSTDSAFTTCSSQDSCKEEPFSHKLAPVVENHCEETACRLPFTELNASPVVPNKHSAVQEVAPEEVVVFTSQPNIMDASTEKGPDVKPETVFESHTIWSNKSIMRSDKAHTELAEDELKAEGEVSVQEVSDAQLDPIQKLFLDKIHEFTAKSKACGGLPDAGPEYKKAFSEELTKLQRLYSNGDLSSFPEFTFSEPVLDEINSK